MNPSGRSALRLTGIRKSYGGVAALKGVTFEVAPGEVHALLGENGAGKSTLMGVAAGAVEADEGTVEIDGVELDSPSPVAARALGIGVVYQHPAILADLTVAENLALALPRDQRPSRRARTAWAKKQLAILGIEVDPNRTGDELTATERGAVEISKALAADPRVVVLDEPTAMLNASEVERLFTQVRAISARGTAVVYISHRIPEVTAIADRVTVLRDGAHRGTFEIGEVSEARILNLIAGREISHVFPPKPDNGRGQGTALEVEDFHGHGFDDISLHLKAGGIVGFAGAEGNGQRNVLRALGGLEGHDGTVRLGGRELSLSSPSDAHASGVRYIPSDRQNEGLFSELTVRENLVASTLHRFQTGGLVRAREERAAAQREMTGLAVKAPSMDAPVTSLSGGNQQKVVFGRTLLAEADVLLCDEPTQGVDAAARVEIYRLLRALADKGKVVVVLSSDALELAGLCDEVVVFSRGDVVSVLEGDDVREERIMQAALRSTAARRDQAAVAAGRSGLAKLGSRFSALGGDHGPAVVLLAAIVLLALYTNSADSAFSSSVNVESLLYLAAALIFVTLGQVTVLLAAGVDLSVGPMVGLTVIVLSFFLEAGAGAGGTALGIGAALGAACVVGLVNGLLIRKAHISPIIATLAMFITLLGVSLLLRPRPEGVISTGFIDTMTTTVASVPVVFIVAVAVALATELALRRSNFGLELRAAGSDETSAHRVGVKVTATNLAAYIACALFACVGGIVVAAQTGIGDPTIGEEYTLLTITAAVLGGTSIYGGRGSFLGALVGAVLLIEITNSTSFLELTPAWQYWLPGGLILVAAGLFARGRGIRVAALETGP